jgi:hypothetical protein
LAAVSSLRLVSEDGLDWAVSVPEPADSADSTDSADSLSAPAPSEPGLHEARTAVKSNAARTSGITAPPRVLDFFYQFKHNRSLINGKAAFRAPQI